MIVDYLSNKKKAAFLLFFVLIIVVYLPGLSGGFIFDDYANITQNVALHTEGVDHISLWRAATSFPHGNGLRPLSMLSFGLNYFIAGDFHPDAFKLANIIIHACIFSVLAVFLRDLFFFLGFCGEKSYWVSLGVSLFWALHPINVSTVLYVVQRMQMLATLFMLLALWCYLRWRRSQVAGNSVWKGLGWVFLFWFLALMSKEDSVLLPAYILILEYSILQFRAASKKTREVIISGHALMLLVGVVAFFSYALPNYWSWDYYPGRNFNSYERLLTQGRVLVMYVSQIIYPLPERMPFYYDNYIVSRGWLDPASSLFSWFLLGIIAVLAWVFRHRNPLVFLGVFWFLVGNFVTSNAVNLELVFEHRNYMPMIGIILALSGIYLYISDYVNFVSFKLFHASVLLALFSLLGVLEWQRATIWGDKLSFAEEMTKIAPQSTRAWIDLCGVYHNLSNGNVKSLEFDKAVKACQNGVNKTSSIMAMTNVIILKTARGDISQEDWGKLISALPDATITPESRSIVPMLIQNFHQGIPLSLDNILEVLEVLDKGNKLSASDYAQAAQFVFENTNKIDIGCGYLKKATKEMDCKKHMSQKYKIN